VKLSYMNTLWKEVIQLQELMRRYENAGHKTSLGKPVDRFRTNRTARPVRRFAFRNIRSLIENPAIALCRCYPICAMIESGSPL